MWVWNRNGFVLNVGCVCIIALGPQELVWFLSHCLFLAAIEGLWLSCCFLHLLIFPTSPSFHPFHTPKFKLFGESPLVISFQFQPHRFSNFPLIAQFNSYYFQIFIKILFVLKFPISSYLTLCYCCYELLLY